MRVRGISINGRLTGTGVAPCVSYEDAKPQMSEVSRNNSWNVNSSGNVNNNNKYNQNIVHPCSADVDFQKFLDTMYEAYEDCLKGKRNSAQALEYMPEAGRDVPRLAREAWTGAYKPSLSTCFMVTFPKLREVFAAAFRDRIIHHWICLRLLPLFERRCHALGDVSHACRKGYGTKSAIAQVQQGMLRVSEHLQRPAWVYKGDIVGFFMNIDKRLMWEMLRELIKQEYKGDYTDILLELTKTTVFHEPQKECVIRSDINMWKDVAKNKSLFYIKEGKGEPIGNLTTQLFAGFYMSYLDKFVQDVFKGKNYSYTRSVDDFVIICDDKDYLKRAIHGIEIYTQERLGLKCHSDKTYLQPVSHGVKFLGQYIYPHRRYTINRTIGRFIDRVNECIKECEKPMTDMRKDYWQQVLNSYFGFLTQTREYRTRKRIREMLPHEWYKYFSITNNRKVTIKNRKRI